MRLLWEIAPATSTEIAAGLKATMGWEATTVKTLLSRLVAKGALSYESKGRAFHYSPLLSEEACVKREMRALVEKIYGGALNKETTHFLFKGRDDPDYLDLLASELETRHEGISLDLQHVLPEKLLVFIHSSQRRLHAALGILEGPAWLRAGYTWGILHLAPRECFTDIAAERAATHTMAQIMVLQVNPAAPYWLQQAISAYEGRWLTRERIATAVKTRIDDVELSMMRDATTSYLTFKESGSYELAYTVAEFVDRTCGAGSLARLLRDPGDFAGIFGCAEGEFWRRWREFARKAYIH